MSSSSRDASRGHVLPFNLQVSVCVIVPLALAFLISGVLWDVLCFNCDGGQQSRAALLQAAKDRTRSRSDGPVEESGAQLSRSTIKRRQSPEGMPQDEPDPDEALDYILESAIVDSEASSGGEAGGSKGGEPEDEEEPLDETPEDYESLYAADSTPSKPAATDASKAGEEEEEPLDEPESPEDYESLYGDAGSDDSSRPKSKPDVAKSATPKEEESSTPGDDSSPDADEDDEVVDEADDEEVGGQLDEPESPEDYESLYGDAVGGGKGDSIPSGPPDGPGSSKANGAGAPPGDAVDEADDVEDIGQLDEPESPEDYESLYGDAVGGGGQGASAPDEKPDAAPGAEARGGDRGGGPDLGDRVDEADDVEDLGPETPEGPEGGSAPAPPAGDPKSGVGRDVTAAEAAGGGGAPKTEYKYGFKLLPPASLGYGDVVPCGDGAEPPADAFETLHPGLNMLLVLGVQKGGTTWMANALMRHPDLIGATRGFTNDKEQKTVSDRRTKEVHYLDRWPHVVGSEARYIEGFPEDQVSAAKANATAQLKAAGVPLKSLEDVNSVRDAYAHLTHDVAFFDGSPNYLPVAHVPPRASQIMPHARFVVVLRDPVARALSAYTMDRSRFCNTGKRFAFFAIPETICPDAGFADTVETTTGEASRNDTCMFDGLDSNGGPQTWHDCFKCWHMFFNMGACNRMEERPVNDCSPETLNYVQVSNYAAQLAWWLAFFPPEQFLILTSAELHDPDRQVDALNRVLDHANLPHARRFTRKWLDTLSPNGFQGSYEEEDTATGIPEAIAMMRERFQKPMDDLEHLINRFWPQMNFTGLPEEK